MKYPNGQIITVGDRVWWNGGAAIGYIKAVAERNNDISSFGLVEPSILISMARDLSCGAPFISYPLRTLDEDGVGLLSEAEDKTARKVLAAISAILKTESASAIGLAYEYSQGILLRWRAIHYQGSKRAIYLISPSLDTIELSGIEGVSALYI